MGSHGPVRPLQRAEIARRTGCNLETVRYYETVGLLPQPPRTQGGHRAYGAEHERRLRFILRARELGFTLAEIRALSDLADERDTSCDQARDVAAAHLREVQEKIADLKRMERVLKDVVAQCADGSRPDCPLMETLFR